MKVSNIILTIASIALILFSYYSISSSKPAEYISQQIKGNGVLVEKSIATSNLHTILLDQAINYSLDPHSNKTTIKSDENILNQLSLKDVNGMLNFKCLFSDTCQLSTTQIKSYNAPILFYKYKPSQYPDITIGLKGIDELILICVASEVSANKSLPKIKTSDTLKMKKLTIYPGHFSTDLLVNVQTLHLNQHGFSEMKISGYTEDLFLNSEFRGKIDASNLRSCNTSLSIGQSCNIDIQAECKISGFADFNAMISNHSTPTKNTLVLNAAKYTEI